jgi:hypothetical protein
MQTRYLCMGVVDCYAARRDPRQRIRCASVGAAEVKEERPWAARSGNKSRQCGNRQTAALADSQRVGKSLTGRYTEGHAVR